MKAIKSGVIRAYFSVRNSWPIWYGILNRAARKKFAARPPRLSAVQSAVLEDLRRDGIAFTTLESLFPDEDMLTLLTDDMRSREQTADRLRKKSFLKPFWDDAGSIGMGNAFFKVALRDEVLAIVNSYDNMWRRLNYLTLAETIPVGDAAPVQSQRWHRDHEEKRMAKMFIYLNDVDEDAGPFTYVKGSQFGSPVYGSLFPQKLPLGIYPEHGAVEKSVDASAIVSATGKAGTVIFCDTAGLHRGGHAKSKPRLMFTSFYPSAMWTEKRAFSLDETVAAANLSPEAQFALYVD